MWCSKAGRSGLGRGSTEPFVKAICADPALCGWPSGVRGAVAFAEGLIPEENQRTRPRRSDNRPTRIDGPPQSCYLAHMLNTRQFLATLVDKPLVTITDRKPNRVMRLERRLRSSGDRSFWRAGGAVPSSGSNKRWTRCMKMASYGSTRRRSVTRHSVHRRSPQPATRRRGCPAGPAASRDPLTGDPHRGVASHWRGTGPQPTAHGPAAGHLALVAASLTAPW